jgi:hypothetical protein
MTHERKPFRRPRMLFFVVLGCAVAALGWLGSAFARPFMKAADMNRENEQLEKQTMELEITQQELRKQHAILKTDSGMELKAREDGYMKPGEAPLIIPDDSRTRQESAK